MLLRGHTAPLTAMLLSPTGTDLVTGSAAGELRVWNLDIGDWCASFSNCLSSDTRRGFVTKWRTLRARLHCMDLQAKKS